ncbi:MAG: accessory factor UbiK family protein [Alphaproteobacteria bacterium]|nr:accessory factor UbiK family protein [Alphaproteobacteria bacterium]
MQTRNPFIDDFSKMMGGAAGAAQAAGEEFRALIRSQMERFVADMDLAKRDEVEALKSLARSALEKVEQLEKRVAELEGGASTQSSPAESAKNA